MMFFGLILFAGILIYLTFWTSKKLKKIQTEKTSSNGYLHILDSMRLEVNQKIYLVQVGQKNILYMTGDKGTSSLDLGNTPLEKIIEKEKFEALLENGELKKGLKNLTADVLKKLEGMKKK